MVLHRSFNSKIKVLLSFTLVVVSSFGFSADNNQALKFEDLPYKNAKVYCENDDNIYPDENDFEFIDYSAMSSEDGERYILATIKNTSSGFRILKQGDILAILGDCARINPKSFERKFKGGEVFTMRLFFGVNKFPILKVLI
ncbi:MAG: hypothetical protein HWE27_04305 [Gammaproteobacteria bacterium]|nr:hypothetical protein [Gammaproteobacteria bacterium]